ncbi:MAG TPA: iron-sulfur cluster-binding domain-containing protein [Acidiphilium sp.]
MTGRPMHMLHCLAVRDETADVKTFVFRAADGHPVAFSAGQAMTFALPVDGERLMRTFSISSAPGNAAVEITVKAHPHGRATPWMHRTIVPGVMVEATGPRGGFVLGDSVPERIAFISAGSGATPLMAMLRSVTNTEADIFWFHAARTPADVLFAADLAALQRRMPRLCVAVTVSRPEPGWFGYHGRVSRRMLSAAAPDLGRRDAFCCGPERFMDAAKLIHAAEGGNPARFHIEHFHAPTAVERPVFPPGLPNAAFTVTIPGGRTFRAAADETILEAATRQAVVIPCGCASGLCGTCRVRRLSGTVAMRHNGGLSPEEEAEDYILACSSRPLSDIAISF